MPEHEWAGDPAIRDVIAGLVSDIPWEARIGELSGGQRRRVALAALLVGDWDVIALDEPTNHLDVEGIAWLADHLKQRWPKDSGGLLVVTHDRWFLDEVCTADLGGARPRSSSRSRAATRPTSCSASSATGWLPPAKPSGRT